MGSLSRELKRWAVEELELPAVRLPDDGYIKTLCVGPGASIWKYITQHVYRERNVRVMRGNLQWYKVLQDKELSQLKNQNKDARRLELQSEINGLQAELNQLDTKISRVEDQLATADQDMNKNWEKFMDSRHRRLLMDSFRQRCTEKRNLLSEDTHIIGTQRKALEDLSKKAEMNLVFGPSGSGNRESGTDPMILRHVRDLCDDRVLFFRTLLESELKANQSAEFTVDQRNAVIQHWMSAAQNVLCSHPPNQVLSALQALTSRQQVELEEKIVNLDVGRDVSALGIRYESDHLIDVSAEQKEELASVQSLLQSAWEEVERSYVELAQTRCRRGQLEAELAALMSKPALALALDTDPLARNVFELELEGVKQVAVRDNIRQQFTQLQLQARQGQEAIRTLQTQWQSVMDFRQLLDRRQEQIRSLIKGNSSLKAELTRVQAEVNRFVQEKLGPQFGNVIKAAGGQRNAVSQGAKHLSCVSLAALDCRVMNGGQKVPAAQLSIHRIQSPAFHKLCEGLSFPMYMNTKDILKKVGNQTALGLIHFYCMDTKPMQVKVDQLMTFFKLSSFVFSGGKKFIQAPEELWSQATNLRLEVRILCRLLHLLSESTAELQTLNAQLPSLDQQTLLQHVKMTDEEILETLLPRARELTMRCSKGLVYAEQVKTAIAHWWEQPGQFALAEMQIEGLTFQQWLQRWKLASKES